VAVAPAESRLRALTFPIDGVRVWVLRLERRPRDRDEGGLDAATQERLAGLRPADADRLVARRVLLRTAVADVAGCRADAVRAVDAEGPRQVETPGGDTWYVSSSSSGAVGLLAVATVPVGADIERQPGPPDALQVSRHFLPPSELAWITAAGADVAARFLETWVRKEAVVKCTGEGLSRDLRTFVVDAGVPSAPVRSPGGTPLSIRTHSVAVAGHVAALALADVPVS
jgi:4'-phosphopantetheinyl transferase